MCSNTFLPDVDDFKVEGTGLTFCLSKWNMDQLKVTFLPTLVQTAVTRACRVVVLIEHSGDWPNVAVEAQRSASLTVNDVALDVVLEAEARSHTGDITLTWLRSVDKRTGQPLWAQEDGGGYRCCILRMDSWEKGTVPPLSRWRAFWKMYQRWSLNVFLTDPINI